MRISRPVQLTGAALGTLCVLTACDGSTATSPPSTPSSTSAGDGPKVPAPLPTKALLSDPCSILTTAEAAQVGLNSPGKNDSTSTLPGCMWKSSATEVNQVGLTALPQNTGGISDIYTKKSGAAYFEPVNVNGYPGIYTDIQDARTQGSCTLWVGVTDQLAVSVIPNIQSGPNKTDPCGIAKKFATAMITHLKS
ncbi:DUF3558 domain-containing protein [Amycolatopsis saalfeldensis]|uniref:DUF3558 domain-containing protein n=1 Tax=Amycolatopsis saalfeldensis TaxID=394193 RepID=A0A1H8YIU9_9PSEU|nr:DUF3558 domain-containing protein [Amycolatopsis saalfeldensis]SEP52013.1 Protein of unknown function [Amycolatopsis saalfeldensis]